MRTTPGQRGVLNTHFFEFIPEEEHDTDDPTVLEETPLLL